MTMLRIGGEYRSVPDPDWEKRSRKRAVAVGIVRRRKGLGMGSSRDGTCGKKRKLQRFEEGSFMEENGQEGGGLAERRGFPIFRGEVIL